MDDGLKRARAAAKREFARRLQKAMIEKGWNQVELARAAQKHLPSERIERDTISNYIRAVAKPTPARLEAVAKALGCQPQDLYPPSIVPPAFKDPERKPALEMKDIGNGNVWLDIRQAVPFDLAIKIMALLKSDG